MENSIRNFSVQISMNQNFSYYVLPFNRLLFKLIAYYILFFTNLNERTALNHVLYLLNTTSADPEEGIGGPDPPPPLRFVRGGVLWRGLMGWRGGLTVVLAFYYQIFFWLASLAIYTNILQVYTSKFNVQYGTVILSLYFHYPNYEKNTTSHPLLF